MLQKLKNKIKKYYIDNLSIPDLTSSLQRLKLLGAEPKYIYDVGAFRGEFAIKCNEIWKNAEIYCFEPLTDKVDYLKSLAIKKNFIHVVDGLVGNKNQNDVIFHESETASSVLNEHVSKNFIVTHKTMRTIDSAIAEFKLPKPDLLKIDTQGFEYEVLEGAASTLSNIEIIIAELNFLDIHENVKLASDVIHLLDSHNFVMYDITEIHHRPSDKAVWQTDFVFVKRDSLLRNNKKW